MSESPTRIAMGFSEAGEVVGVSKSFLRNAANDPNPSRRLKTVRIGRRVLIRERDLMDWFNRVALPNESHNEPQVA